MKKRKAIIGGPYIAGQNGRGSQNGSLAANGAAARADGSGGFGVLASGLPGSPAAGLRSRHFARLLLLAAAIGCGFALNARSGAAEWLLFSVTSAAAFIGWVLPYALAGTWTVHREQIEQTAYEDGGEMRIRLKLLSSRPLPFMWVSVREELANVAHDRDRTISIPFRTVYIPWLARSRTITYTVTDLRRGVLAFQPVRIEVGDLLGMTVRTFTVPCPGQAVVLPKPPEGERVVSMPGAAPGPMPLGHSQARIAASSPLSAALPVLQAGSGPDSRTYVPGDPLRRINWRAMARGLGMQTRVEQPGQPGESVILLDTSLAAYGRDGRLFDASVGRAAMAIHYAVRAGRSVTVLYSGIRLHVRADDPAQLRRALEELARIRAEDVMPLSERLREIMAKLPRGADIICITAEEDGEPAGGTVTGAGTEGATGAGSGSGSGAKAATGAGSGSGSRAKVGTGADAGLGSRAKAETNSDAFTAADAAAIDRVEAIRQAARLAAVRGGALYLWLGCEWSDPAAREQIWRSSLQNADCRLSILPMPADYMRQPVVMEGGERDGFMVQ
ncbi:DUF58 domain-containing protein [Paenibacillus spongiae]|uniref:DUF58 domain-containing protein n=1 Tax=Paenibacillus spongiae TaxID=2909671 RepID=A0ABY5SBK5_9BACL|nr:DUF58 domain-containing protein [Paenibacillus spongiae]UVI30908.1 DUF58 domain-containing protein [Paenibacillus spongiae]